MDEKDILNQIQQSRRPVEKAIYPNRPGLHAIFLSQGASLGNVANSSAIIYFGKAEDSLASRDFKTHFTSGKTGSSTLRRSLGAVLKSELKLKAIPRSPKRTSTDMYNYKFTADGEEALTKWMKSHLPPRGADGEPTQHEINPNTHTEIGPTMRCTTPLPQAKY